MQSSNGSTKILPFADASFRHRCWPAYMTKLTVRLNEVLIDGDLQLNLVQQFNRQLMAAIKLRIGPFCRPNPRQSIIVRRKTATLLRASLTGFDLRRLNDGR